MKIRKMLQMNSKMKNSSVLTYNFNLPAVLTCPNAGTCKERLTGTNSSYCFAYREEQQYPNARAFRNTNWEVSKQSNFVELLDAEIKAIRTKGKQLAVRIHASGDFYSPEYLKKWIEVSKKNINVVFYAYTKSHAMVLRLNESIPKNLIIIHSLGSNIDALVTKGMRHARIFNSEADALAAGYVLANEDDSMAWQSTNPNIGLVIFGALSKRFKSGGLQEKLKIA